MNENRPSQDTEFIGRVEPGTEDGIHIQENECFSLKEVNGAPAGEEYWLKRIHCLPGPSFSFWKTGVPFKVTRLEPTGAEYDIEPVSWSTSHLEHSGILRVIKRSCPDDATSMPIEFKLEFPAHEHGALGGGSHPGHGTVR